MDRVLVTGATGYIGASLTRRLIELNKFVGIIKRPSSNMDKIIDIKDKLAIYDYDGSPESLLWAFNDFHPEVVFHLASSVIARHDTEDIETLVNSNILFGTQILEAMRLAHITKIINASTFWQTVGIFTLYTALKQAFECVLKFYANVYNIKSISLRLPDTYGPNDNRPKIINLVHKAACSGEKIKMTAGEQEMDLLYIDDVIDGFLSAGELLMNTEEKFQVFSLSSKKPKSLRYVVELYSAVNKVLINVEWGAIPYREKEIMKVKVPGNVLPSWEPIVSLEEGLRNILKK